MKPLIDMTAKNDNSTDTQPLANVERARKRESRQRHLKGPAWATSPRVTQVA